MLSEAIRLQPDVIVVDVGMPLLNGLEAAWRIRKQAPNIKFIFLTMRDDPSLAAAALLVLRKSIRKRLLAKLQQVKDELRKRCISRWRKSGNGCVSR
jgi:DNA-binding NarL/FixJ family response regulator